MLAIRTLMASLLAAIGIYGIMAYTVARLSAGVDRVRLYTMNSVATSLLESCAGGVIPLNANEFQPQDLPANLMSTPVEQLFPDARDPKAALAGLLLIAGHWDLSHQISQDTPSKEGSYWHAIAHRVEPDSSNAAYWFRRVGEHAIYPDLYRQTTRLLPLKKRWDADFFLAFCDEARNSAAERRKIACQIQRLECDLLLSWCALKRKDL